MTVLILVFILALIPGFLMGAWWAWRRVKKQPPPPVYKHPDRFDEPALAKELGLRLTGIPADGSRAVEGPSPNKVIWVDAGDEVLVHLDSTTTRIVGRTLLVSVDLETDQTGRAPVIVAFALGDGNDNAGLVATTDATPHGHPVLASRWGAAVRASIWNSLLGIAEDHAAERDLAASSISADAGQLRIGVNEPLRASPPRSGAP